MSPDQFNGIARTLAREIRHALREQAQTADAPGSRRPPGRNRSCRDLKATHDFDRLAAGVAQDRLAAWRCNVFIEGEKEIIRDDAEFAMFLDPVDGSLNRERDIGDPAFAVALAHRPRIQRPEQLEYAYIEGLRSGKVYRLDAAGNALLEQREASATASALACAAPETLHEAVGYIRPGYGMARPQLGTTLAVALAAGDLRAFDNAATELCEIAGGAVDFMVEARGISDGFNLIAWPLLRAAGGVLRSLEGDDLASAPFDPAAPLDYIAAGNERIARQIAALIERFAPETRATVDRLHRDVTAWYGS